MEEPVRERVRFQSRHGRHGVVPSVGQHVVPLEDLVQDDAIHETTESEAQDERGGFRRSCPTWEAQWRGAHAAYFWIDFLR